MLCNQVGLRRALDRGRRRRIGRSAIRRPAGAIASTGHVKLQSTQSNSARVSPLVDDEMFLPVPLVGVVMGSQSDWEVMKHACAQLEAFGIPFESRVVSAHRMPDQMFEYAEGARGRGLRIIIAGAGGAAHLPGMIAAKTTLPVLGVPVPSRYLRGADSLLSMVQMPTGVPVATFAIGEAGAANAALFAIAMLSTSDASLKAKLDTFREGQTARAAAMSVPPRSHDAS